jgi:hypothetical protein
MTTRILLGQLGSNGDCLYATTIARQIKHDFPGCHLTWAISSLCRRVILNNPDVDEVWELPVDHWGDMDRQWRAFEAEAWKRVAKGDFDRAFMTQICPNYFHNYDGTIRPSQFRNYPGPITVPVETVIEVTLEERERVEEWVWTHNVDAYAKAVLFECSSKSGQSFMTPALALKIATRVIEQEPDVCFILSTHEPLKAGHPQIVHGGALSLRETAALTHHVDLFVGCGSGVTVVATSGGAKPALPNIQVLEKDTSVFASFKHDFDYFNKPSGHFLEITRNDADRLANAVRVSLMEGLPAAEARFGDRLQLDFTWYFELIDRMLLRERRYIDAAHSLLVTAGRYGWRNDLLGFGQAFILPFLDLDDGRIFPNRRNLIERFQQALSEREAAA